MDIQGINRNHEPLETDRRPLGAVPRLARRKSALIGQGGEVTMRELCGRDSLDER